MKLNFNDILLLVKNKKYNESIEYLDKLIQDDRNNFDYYYLLGISYLNLGKLDNAIESFSHAINIKDDNFIFYHFRGLAYLKLNRLNEAKKDFDKLIELKIDFPEVYNNLGVLLYSLGKNEQAIKNFSKSINLNNDTIGSTQDIDFNSFVNSMSILSSTSSSCLFSVLLSAALWSSSAPHHQSDAL